MKNPIIDAQVEETMNSLDNLQRAEANPYLYTRIQQRLQNKLSSERFAVTMFRWAIVLLVFLTLNVFTYERLSNEEATQTSGNSIEAFANEYELQESANNY